MRIMKFLVVLAFVVGTYAQDIGDACTGTSFDPDPYDCIRCSSSNAESGSFQIAAATTGCGTVEDSEYLGVCDGTNAACGPPDLEATVNGLAATCSPVDAVKSTDAPVFQTGTMVSGNGQNIRLVFKIPCLFTTEFGGSNSWNTVGGGGSKDGNALRQNRRCSHNDHCNDGAYCAKTCTVGGNACGLAGETILVGDVGAPGFCADMDLCDDDPTSAVSGNCNVGTQSVHTDHEIVHTESWTTISASAAGNADLINNVDTAAFVEYFILTEFTGVAQHQWDYQYGKPFPMPRTVHEQFAMKFLFKKSVEVSQGVTQTYAVILTQATLTTTRAQKQHDAMALTVDFLIETRVNAPFRINYAGDSGIDVTGAARHSLVDDKGAGYEHDLFYQQASSANTANGNCEGPYVTTSTGASDTEIGTDICTQVWHFRAVLNLAERCEVDDAYLTFQDVDGISCGPNAGGYACPLDELPQPDEDPDDYTFVVGVSTANACTSFTVETNACAHLELRTTGGDVSANFAIGDQYQVYSYIGASAANADGDSIETTGLSTQVTGASNDLSLNPTGTCFGTGPCTRFDETLALDGACSLDQHVITGDNAAGACPDHAYDCLYKATERFDSASFDLGSLTGDPTGIEFSNTIVATINEGLKKISISTKDQFYALLQTEETGELRSVATAGLSAAPAEEVEEVQAAPETAVQEELALGETSSNLVYIVVGVLLVLSIAIAAVVMYMRRVKGSKKVQPVVPLPITIETTSASSTA